VQHSVSIPWKCDDYGLVLGGWEGDILGGLWDAAFFLLFFEVRGILDLWIYLNDLLHILCSLWVSITQIILDIESTPGISKTSKIGPSTNPSHPNTARKSVPHQARDIHIFSDCCSVSRPYILITRSTISRIQNHISNIKQAATYQIPLT